MAGHGGSVERVGAHTWIGRNDRGAEVRIGTDEIDGAFSPGELLQLAVAACTTVTIEDMVVRRSGPDARVDATVERDREPGSHEYQRISVTLDVDLEGLGDAERERVVKALRTAIDRECTISRTVKTGMPIDLDIVAGGRAGGGARAS
ncbi:OsmC family protein [Actinoplanes sp. NPDC051470]|uniref:OsmC family protein n=1 Tax=unclassified Actinoplanes TaxID=2626549 RepID=UPI003423B104